MNAAPVAAIAFGLVSVIVSTEASLVPMDAGAKLLPTVSAFATTRVSVADPVVAPAFVVVTAPTGSVLV